jgi:carbonic anhydrase
MRTQTKETQAQLTPEKALEILKQGNQRFVKNLMEDRHLLKQANETCEQQYPFATILSCIDSRTSAELIFDQGLGDIFSIRIAGNIVNDDILGSMEYACKVAGTKLLLVLGHTRCGAITSAYQGIKLGHLTGLLDKIQPAVEEHKTACCDEGLETDEQATLQCIAKHNVFNSIEHIMEKSKILRDMAEKKQIIIVGGMYDLQSGHVEFYPPAN